MNLTIGAVNYIYSVFGEGLGRLKTKRMIMAIAWNLVLCKSVVCWLPTFSMLGFFSYIVMLNNSRESD